MDEIRRNTNPKWEDRTFRHMLYGLDEPLLACVQAALEVQREALSLRRRTIDGIFGIVTVVLICGLIWLIVERR